MGVCGEHPPRAGDGVDRGENAGGEEDNRRAGGDIRDVAKEHPAETVERAESSGEWQ